MKNIWIRLVFVICTLTTLTYLTFAFTCRADDAFYAYPFTHGFGSTLGGGEFAVALGVHLQAVVSLHVLSFIFIGQTGHLRCMLAWLIPAGGIAIVSFVCGKPLSEGWPSAFALPCHWLAATTLVIGTLSCLFLLVYRVFYKSLTA